MESIAPTAMSDELRPLLLEHLPAGPLETFGVCVRLGPGDDLVGEPGVQLVVGLDFNLGVKNCSRTRPTWFSTWPFSQPDAGVHATGSTR